MTDPAPLPEIQDDEVELTDDLLPPGDPDAPPLHVIDVVNVFEQEAVDRVSAKLARAVSDALQGVMDVAAKIAAAHGIEVGEDEVAVALPPTAEIPHPRVAVFRRVDMAAKEAQFSSVART